MKKFKLIVALSLALMLCLAQVSFAFDSLPKITTDPETGIVSINGTTTPNSNVNIIIKDSENNNKYVDSIVAKEDGAYNTDIQLSKNENYNCTITVSGIDTPYIFEISTTPTTPIVETDPTVFVDPETGIIEISGITSPDNYVNIVIKSGNARYYVDSIGADENGEYSTKAKLPLNMKFNCNITISGKNHSLEITTEPSYLTPGDVVSEDITKGTVGEPSFVSVVNQSSATWQVVVSPLSGYIVDSIRDAKNNVMEDALIENNIIKWNVTEEGADYTVCFKKPIKITCQNVEHFINGEDAILNFMAKNESTEGIFSNLITGLYRILSDNTLELVSYNYIAPEILANGAKTWETLLDIPSEGNYKIKAYAWDDMEEPNTLSNIKEVIMSK